MNDLYFDGITNGDGNPVYDKKYLNSDGSLKSEYDNIHIHLNDVSPNYDPPKQWGIYKGTTECLVVKKQLVVQGEGKTIEIINTVTGNKKVDNNGGAYALNGNIKFTNVDSVYIASIGGNEFGNHSTALTASGANANIEISGKKVHLIGSIDIKNGKNATIKVDLSGKESFWYGSAIGESETNKVEISLTNGATWIINPHFSITSSSGGKELNHLTLNQGIVLLADDLIWERYNNTVITNNNIDYKLANYRDSNGRYSEVRILNLSGPGGFFNVDLDWQSNKGAKKYTDKSDFIKIGQAEDNSNQTVWFDISKAHLDEMKNGDKLYFASVESGNTTFSTNADGEVNRADELYRFGLHTQSEEDETDQLTYWFLTKSIGSANENVDFLNNAVLASFSLASDLDRFHERQGEARHEERGTNGLWARYRYSDIGRKHAFDMDKNMIQVGYNKEVSTADSHKIVSLAFDYTRADTDLFGVSGSGSSDRYGLNLYYTVLGESGSYADFNAKIGRLGSDYNLRNDSGQKIGGSLWQTFYGVSAELGWKFELNDFLFIEPQTQLQVIRIEGTRFETESGIKAQIADTNSIIGRVGFRAGSSFSFGSAERISTAYIYGDVLREFKGDHVFAARGHSTSVDFSYADKETWYDAGIGANLSLSSNTDLWLNAKYIFGGYFESSRQINAGVRFSF
ncbi:autotransporter outer membrane beta-barrel domain-containing protein [Sutterella wadsworthensis]|uniref:autotransporter outer membrane beta-barrel domain-containing protein n=1 Tax=Sutterella wadsworthensis TaxID=40545 RepID=UPI00242CB708|nr:autotransporter outer membrane beta-barrel domain-containing protein [Sutterella wadsworthensis]